jgi:hypothetical protein
LAVLRLRVFSEVTMKSFSFAKALTLGCLVCLTLPVACGDDDDGPGKPNGGSANNGGAGATDAGGPSEDGGTPAVNGGAPASLPPGLSDTASEVECGENTCESVTVAGGAIYVDPCCTAGDSCGVSTGFLGLIVPDFPNACAPKDQPGDVDEACPSAEGLAATVPLGGTMLEVAIDPLVGCCRPNGTCGVVLNDVTGNAGKLPVGSFGLGCVDGAPFFEGESTACGAGGGGSGGAGGTGAGGEPTTAGGAVAGGAGGAGGAQ